MIILRFALFFLLIPILFSCVNELDIIDEGNDIPVVYGFIDPSENAQYIRVERAFADENRSAYELALVEDSLYYDQVQVSLFNQRTGTTHQLEKVNGTDDGYIREPGPFLTDPNYLYKIKTELLDLQGGDTIVIEIDRGVPYVIATSSTIVVPDMELYDPEKKVANFRYESEYRVSWRSDDIVGLYDLLIHFHYLENTPELPEFYTPKTTTWKVLGNIEHESGRFTQYGEFKGVRLYKFLANNLSDTLPVLRKFESFDIEVVAVGLELIEFIRIIQANSGLTGSQELPTYSNIENGLGIFSSKNRLLSTDFRMNQESVDSLINGVYTRSLGFIQ